MPVFLVRPFYTIDAMLQTESLTFAYNRDNQFQFPDVDCAKGSQWLLLGESGSGKTTLLHLLGGLRKPKAGRIIINDQDITRLTGAALDHFRGQHIGIIFQQSHFVKALTIKENLELARTLAGLPSDAMRIQQILDRLNIGNKGDVRPTQLSVGEQQRASIARALVNGPDIILADEPTSALDDTNCAEVLKLLRDQAAQDQATLLIVTHDNRLKSAFKHQIHLEKLTHERA